MLLTEWLKIGVAGPTIDGREIDPEWLRSMARNYDPATYMASVNEDHFFPGGLGTVHELKIGKDERGRLALWARLNPKAGLLSRVQNGFNIFFSMEVRHGFPGDGEHYLTGLAATDEPASLGLTPTKLAANGAELIRQAVPARLEQGDICDTDQEAPEDKEKLTAQPPEKTPDTEQPPEQMPGWFQNFLETIKSPFSGAGAETQTETDPMKPEEIKRLEAVESGIAEIKTLLTAKAPGDQEAAASSPADPATDDGEAPTAEKLAADQSGTDALTATLEEIKQGQAAINERLNKHDAFMGDTLETEALEVTEGEEGQAPGVW